MPPQQCQRLLDLIDNGLDFGAHGFTSDFRIRGGNLMAGPADHKPARERLVRTWKLLAAVREDIPSGATTGMFGSDPQGILNYSPEGRMIALITRGDRKPATSARPTPAEAEALFRSMLSYAGAYTVEGDMVIHYVDISWNQSFTGGEQKRHFKFEGERLQLSTPQSLDPIDGKMSVRRLTWEKV
jgi:hypothetical protein